MKKIRVLNIFWGCAKSPWAVIWRLAPAKVFYTTPYFSDSLFKISFSGASRQMKVKICRLLQDHFFLFHHFADIDQCVAHPAQGGIDRDPGQF